MVERKLLVRNYSIHSKQIQLAESVSLMCKAVRVCVCVCARERACVLSWLRARMRACVRACLAKFRFQSNRY